MTDNLIESKKEGYLDFEEYIRQGEPDKREKASIWQTAIGLQAVDGLKTSDYLKETARRHIEGDIDIDQARELIKTYYQSKAIREPDDDDKQEADKVSANITKILSSQTLDFSTKGYNLHINPTKEWREQPNLDTRTSNEQVPEQVPEQVGGILHIDNPLIIGLIKEIGDKEQSISEMMEVLGLRHRPNFLEYHLNPAIKGGLVRMLYPDSPRHPRQKYVLTPKGLLLFKELEGA